MNRPSKEIALGGKWGIGRVGLVDEEDHIWLSLCPGVTRSGKTTWRARLGRIHLGTFATEEEARETYLLAKTGVAP